MDNSNTFTKKVMKKAKKNDPWDEERKRIDVHALLMCGTKQLILDLQSVVDNDGNGILSDELSNVIRTSAVRVLTKELHTAVADGSLQEAELLLDDIKEVLRYAM